MNTLSSSSLSAAFAGFLLFLLSLTAAFSELLTTSLSLVFIFEGKFLNDFASTSSVGCSFFGFSDGFTYKISSIHMNRKRIMLISLCVNGNLDILYLLDIARV
jgi:hypothetical protein